MDHEEEDEDQSYYESEWSSQEELYHTDIDYGGSSRYDEPYESSSEPETEVYTSDFEEEPEEKNHNQFN
ncbi:unnamed protein product, partial [Cochlearia groenlandica]